jgi:hypothetical protein
MIPIGRGVDDDLNPLRAAGGNDAARLIAILRADIDGWIGGRVPFSQYVGKFGGIIGGEKHIMAR